LGEIISALSNFSTGTDEETRNKLEEFDVQQINLFFSISKAILVYLFPLGLPLASR